MGTSERREREKEVVRKRILDAARALFMQDGYEAVSMRKIAEAIEYSPTAIYQYFRDKSELVLALCEADFEAWGRRFFALKDVRDPVERLRRSGEEYVRFAVENPSHYRLMFMSDHMNSLDQAALRKAYESGQTVCVPGAMNRLSALGAKLLPRTLATRAAGSVMKRSGRS